MKRALIGLFVLMVLSTVAWADWQKANSSKAAYRQEVDKDGQVGRFHAVQMSTNSLAVIDTAKGYVWVTLATREGAGILYLGDLFPVDESFTQIHFKSAKTDDVPIGAPVPNK